MKKKNRLFLLLVMMSIFLGISIADATEMSSTNFHITTTVISDGGGFMNSANFQINGTVGQPTPLPDTADPPFADSYDLFPGFWNVIANINLFCPGDDDFDKDIDGLDLAAYILDSDGVSLNDFALNFGKANCP